MRTNNQQGFSAIELLITLFIAGIFLVSGYQMYSMITKDGSEARQQAQAYNLAKLYLQNYKSTVGATCMTTPPPAIPTINVAGLTNPSLIPSVTCPYGSASPITKITVTLRYGSNPQNSVQDSTYASL